MNGNENLTSQDIELFMLAQFMDVIDVLEKYETIDEVRKDIKVRRCIYFDYIKQIQESMGVVTLSLFNENIDEKLRDCRDAYSDSTEYKLAKQKLIELRSKTIEKLEDIEKLEEMNKLMYEIYSFEIRLAYKIGMIDGIKIKEKCN